MERVLICGDRNWVNKESIHAALVDLMYSGDLGLPSTVIHGAARGADTLGGQVAKEMDFDVEAYPALWDKHGKAAGPIRNQQMLDEGKPKMVLAFHSDIGNSKGTLDMIKRSNKAGIPVRLYAK